MAFGLTLAVLSLCCKPQLARVCIGSLYCDAGGARAPSWARVAVGPLCCGADKPSWPKPKLRLGAPPQPGRPPRQRQIADIAEYSADGLVLKDRVPLDCVDDSVLRTLVTRSAEPALVFFTDDSGECLLAEALLERSGAEHRKQTRLGLTPGPDQLRIVKAPMASCGRLFTWTRSQGQPLSTQRFPACVIFVRGSPVATLLGTFTPQELGHFIYNALSKSSGSVPRF